MFKSLTGALVAVAAFGGLVAASAPASAMPMVDINPALSAHADGVSAQDVRWVCGPYHRCFWRPGYYRPAYPGYGWGRPGWGGPGWGRPGWRGPYRHRAFGWHRHYGWHRW